MDDVLKAQEPRRISTWIFGITLLTLGLAVRLYGAQLIGNRADVAAYLDQVVATEQGQNVYARDMAFPYLPGWLGIEVATYKVSKQYQIPFDQLIRWLIIAADFGVLAVLFYLRHALNLEIDASYLLLGYWLNPIVIDISGFHGQFDAVALLPALLGLALWLKPRGILPAGVLLGIAVTIKPYMVLPAAVLALRSSAKSKAQAILFSAGAILVIGLSLLPYWPQPWLVISKILSYSGLNDQALGGLFRSAWLFRAGNFYLPGAFGEELCNLTRIPALFLMLYAGLRCAESSIANCVCAIYFGFLIIYGGVSTQYLTWPVAWMLLQKMPLRAVLAYSVTATLAALSFYAVYWPGFFGAEQEALRSSYAVWYMLSQVLLQFTLIFTFVFLVRSTALPTFKPLRILSGLSLAGMLISSLFMYERVHWYVAEWLAFPRA